MTRAGKRAQWGGQERKRQGRAPLQIAPNHIREARGEIRGK